MNNDFTSSWNAIFKKEGLKNTSGETKTIFESYLKNNNINTEDETNPMVILYKETIKIDEWLYDRSYKTVRDIAKAEGKLELVRKYIHLLEENKK